ncbi:hypothetical protein PO124_08885 [Bacillus licheniformis]|nr:hypothetical protein [Bacillus licheniformis]
MHIEAVIDKIRKLPGFRRAENDIERHSTGRHTSQNRSTSSLRRPETPAC